MYKVLDLREGTYLQREDIFGNTFDAEYIYKHDAESAIVNICYLAGLHRNYEGQEKLLPCYFEIMKS